MSSPLTHGGRGAYKAFTLIELLTVIAIIGVLAGITFGAANALSRRSKIDKAKAEMAIIAQALETYKQRYGDYPHNVDADNNKLMLNPKAPGFSVTDRDRAYQFLRTLLGRLDPRGNEFRNSSNTIKYQKASLAVESFTLERKAATEDPNGDNILPEFRTGSAVADPDFSNALLDPWGNRYVYVYKLSTAPNNWRQPGFVLMSAGPDGVIVRDDAALAQSFLPATGAIDDHFMAEVASNGAGNADNVIHGR